MHVSRKREEAPEKPTMPQQHSIDLQTNSPGNEWKPLQNSKLGLSATNQL